VHAEQRTFYEPKNWTRRQRGRRAAAQNRRLLSHVRYCQLGERAGILDALCAGCPVTRGERRGTCVDVRVYNGAFDRMQDVITVHDKGHEGSEAFARMYEPIADPRTKENTPKSFPKRRRTRTNVIKCPQGPFAWDARCCNDGRWLAAKTGKGKPPTRYYM
jgi:hypothetical protein